MHRHCRGDPVLLIGFGKFATSTVDDEKDTVITTTGGTTTPTTT